MGNFTGSVAFGRWSWPGRPTSADGHRPAIGGHRMDGVLTSQKVYCAGTFDSAVDRIRVVGQRLCTHEVIR